MTALPITTAIYAEAYKLAAEGYGYEDIYVKLKSQGLTRSAAKLIVLGKKR